LVPKHPGETQARHKSPDGDVADACCLAHCASRECLSCTVILAGAKIHGRHQVLQGFSQCLLTGARQDPGRDHRMGSSYETGRFARVGDLSEVTSYADVA